LGIKVSTLCLEVASVGFYYVLRVFHQVLFLGLFRFTANRNMNMVLSCFNEQELVTGGGICGCRCYRWELPCFPIGILKGVFHLLSALERVCIRVRTRHTRNFTMFSCSSSRCLQLSVFLLHGVCGRVRPQRFHSVRRRTNGN
jgi:hypothetical protein